ncbi:chromatin modification-related protein eaf-1-like isoform X7 [Pimephales promelas]|uniref:chromatin modification-related protein eaf-1-like isoform X7 n=1 Tax=Pimephales promelas TaxID=90988 RepID=UPI001955832D|nr:chromatin modification-related protein eaf-1-like isoform X7 [Pimephales promelas]
MAGSWRVQSLALCVWLCVFCHAVPKWSNLPQSPQALMFQQTDQRFQKPVQQQASQQFPQSVQQASHQFPQSVQQASQQFPQFVQQQAGQQFPQSVQQQASQQASHQFPQSVQQASQQFPQLVQQQASQQFPQFVQQQAGQQFPQSVQQQASQQFPQFVQQQAGQQFPQSVQQQASQQASHQFPQLVQQQAGQQFPQSVQQQASQQASQQFPQSVQQQASQQASHQFPQSVQQASQQFPQLVQQQASQQFPQFVQQQAGQQFPQSVQQQASQQFPQFVQQQAGQQFPQSVQQQAGQQFPQSVQQQASQQASHQFPQLVQQQAGQQFPQSVQQQASQQASQQFPQSVQQQASQQASHQFPQSVQQASQQFPQLVQQQASQQFPQFVQQQAGQQFPQSVQQQASQQFPQFVQQQAGQQFPQSVQQQAGQQFPQSVQQQASQQASQQFPQQFQPVAKAEPVDKCAVADYEQIQCGPPGISGAECAAINCCFNGQQCYYGKAVTVQCIRDGQFVVVVARDVTLPRLSLDSVRLLGGNDPACSPVGSTPFFAIYQFPVTACGTSMMEDGGYVVYENRMTSSYEVGIGPLGSITRDSHFELLFQCRYSGTSVEALVVEVNTVPPPPPVAAPGPLRVELRLANGQCFTKGCAEGDEAYTSYYSDSDYPVTKVLREPVFVEVRVLERTDPNIVLMLGHCWATSTPSPLSLPQWDLLVDGCPYQDDRYLTTLVPVSGSSGFQFPTHYKRFIVKMFTFVDPSSLAPLQETIFIHCSTAVCHPSSGSCEQSCTRKRRDTPIKTISSGQTVVSSGEVNLVK